MPGAGRRVDGRPSQSGTFIPGQNTDFALDAYDTKGQGILRTRVPKGTYLLETPVQTRKGTQADPDTRKGVTWGFSAGQHQPGSGDDSLEVIFNEPTPKAYQRGKTYTQTFNVGVFSPKINTYNTARRSGNDLSFCIAEYTDGAGNIGLSTVTKQQTRVTADGKKLLNSEEGLCQDVYGLPSKSAAYRISTDATRSTKVAGVTTRLTAAWTFRSKKTPADNYTVLPLSSVRFAPKLDLHSRAAAGKKLTVPLTLQGPAAKSFKSLSVQVSYNGGKTWSKAPVLTNKSKRTLSLSHPKKATSVSLKAKLTDRQGNTYQVTIVKAYLLK